MEPKAFIRPGRFSEEAWADNRRIEFDFKNQVIVQHDIPVDTVFFGDSITHFWELNAYFEGKEGIIVNRGIGGDNTVYAKRRLEADVIQLKPRRCVMLLGVNDAWDMEEDNWWQLPALSLEEALTRAEENLHEICDRILTAGIELYVCSVMPTNMKFTIKEELRHDFILALNEDLEAYCGQTGAVWVDYYSAMVSQDGRTVKDGLTFEGIHPNVFGYDIMAGELAKVLPVVKK